MRSNAVCVMFYGPASIKTRPRLLLGGEGALAPFDEENAPTCKKQVLPKRMRPRAFETAVKEIDVVFKQFGTARLVWDVSHLKKMRRRKTPTIRTKRIRGRRLDEQSEKEEE